MQRWGELGGGHGPIPTHPGHRVCAVVRGCPNPVHHGHTAGQRQVRVLLASEPLTPGSPLGLPLQVHLPSTLVLADPGGKHLLSPTSCPAEAGHGPGDGRHESTFSIGTNRSWDSQMPRVPSFRKAVGASLTHSALHAGTEEDPARPPAGVVHAQGPASAPLARLPQHSTPSCDLPQVAGPLQPGPHMWDPGAHGGRQTETVWPGHHGRAWDLGLTPHSSFPKERALRAPGSGGAVSQTFLPSLPAPCASCSQ